MKKAYYREQALERIARDVITAYDPRLYYGSPVAIPIEDIIEAQGLVLEYQYLRNNGRVLGETIFDDGLTAIYDRENHRYDLLPVKGGTILIDCSLCEEEASTGRLRFTCAHELGHWLLHKKQFSGTGENAALRSGDESDNTLEVQANLLGSTVLDAVKLFTSFQTDMIFYTAEDVSTGGAMLCAAAGDITQRIKKILWQPDQAFVLTSGTMAVGSDFRRFKTQAGLEKGHRVMESVSPSPFDYRNNCLLYLPQIPPRQRVEDTDVYFNELTAELVGLIKAASGHALVLFTSYAAMSAVKERLREESLPFPLLTLGRNAPHIIEQFRHTPGAVLLATGAAWEGFDFPGDCVSLLIIPRLPFAYPDARKERELEKYPSLHAFIREVAVPEMQIKLRQGFGRAIRTESDTCVIAILDERACRGRRYAQAVSEALPEMRRTGSLREVTRFLREKKPESYFEVGR